MATQQVQSPSPGIANANDQKKKTMIDALKREIGLLRELQHPNIVQIHDIGEHGGAPYFSLEYCEGGSLAHRLRGTPLPANDTVVSLSLFNSVNEVAYGPVIVGEKDKARRWVSPGST